MLEYFIIHGDLSAYNILYWEGEPVIIDFPQVVDPMANCNACFMFHRDVKRICEYFNGCGLSENPNAIARDLWEKYVFSCNDRPFESILSD